MSQQNVNLIRAGFEAWNRGDMEALRKLYAPDVVMRPVENWPEPGPFVGREAVMRQWEQQRDTFDADALQPIGDFIAVADHVLARLIWRGAGRGPQADLEMTSIWTVRRGQIVGQEFFWDHTEALEAVGLSDREAHAES
jgi:ketosteroid isomerase-like protein